jgi:hypothetical protein
MRTCRSVSIHFLPAAAAWFLGRPKFLGACPPSDKQRSMQTVHPLDAAARDRRNCGNGVMAGNWKA